MDKQILISQKAWLYFLVSVLTSFPPDPGHVVTAGAGAALVCEHGLQLVVAAVV